ncbi:MAG: hypothetical protein IPO78_00440 [Saprospiraceae bacterium]|nr:hypothetical protein [Saprospiraceae bacterium]MBK8450937.1 hypothetical protein [Saprospiraceae bacterium]MBK8485659.1 hypothetical protein [Saprospiraceae bacterium]MBK9222888.1 hypothetical protein [Saprospiraceae bacterium]MBK9720069.1 hypothetical protein [Saprospiraceae bacterium]
MNEPFEKYLQLEDDLRRYRKALNEAIEIMLDQEVSNYPIFIVHQQELEMGIKIIEAGEKTGIWSVHASSLEEFVVKSLIENDKVEEFIRVYKEHPDNFCLFVLSELGAKFIFYPRTDHLYTEYGNLN